MSEDTIINDLKWLAERMVLDGHGEYREYHVVTAAIKEIEQLRSIAGVVEALHKTSFRDIKDEINGAPV